MDCQELSYSSSSMNFTLLPSVSCKKDGKVGVRTTMQSSVSFRALPHHQPLTLTFRFARRNIFAGHIYSEMRPMPTMKQHACFSCCCTAPSAWRSKTAYSVCMSTKHLLSIPNLLGAARHRLYYRFYNFNYAIPSLPGCQPPRSGQ